jgi:hypothetical protein
MIKPCKYPCGRKVYWSDEFKFWADAENGELHSYKRCAELQKEKGLKPVFFDKVKK